MKYLAVSIYIENFAGTFFFLQKPTLPHLNLCLYICLNEEIIGKLCCQKNFYFYNIDYDL